jgi:hypothetical protein
MWCNGTAVWVKIDVNPSVVHSIKSNLFTSLV